MAREESLMTQAWRDLLAYEFPPTVLEVERGNIRRWTEAVGAPNPLWNDDEYARKSRSGWRRKKVKRQYSVRSWSLYQRITPELTTHAE